MVILESLPRWSRPLRKLSFTAGCLAVAILNSSSVRGESGMSLHAGGNANEGFTVSILYKGKIVATPAGLGEFSARFQNGSRELDVQLQNWKATSWSGNDHHITLLGESKLEDLKTNLSVRVDYEVLTPQVVRKQIQLHQVDSHLLYYEVTNRLRAAEAPGKFWSFDQLTCKGGPLHEYFPAAGFRTQEGVTVGLLTDSGYRNGWNRIIRRDNGEFIKPAPREISDVNLNYVSNLDDRFKKQFGVDQTFGEELVQDQSAGEPIALPPLGAWTKQGDPSVASEGAITRFAITNHKDGLITPVPLRGGQVYQLSFEYRSQSRFAARVWDADDHLKMVKDLTLYNDGVPRSGDRWSTFSTRTYIPALQGQTAALVLGNIEDSAPTVSGSIEIRNLRLNRVPSHFQPFHRLEMDHSEQKTVFIFADENIPDTIRGYRLASELYLADALGFRGGDPEKVLYSDMMMLSWTAEPHVPRPVTVPSIYYGAAGEMYFRDSFFAVSGTHNRELNESIFNLWAANQGPDGEIGTLINANRGHIERKSNDSTPLWLLWALRNRQRFGSELPVAKLRKAAEYCLRTYDPEHNGVCHAQYIIGQNDVIEFPHGTTEVAANQGMWALTLRVIKELAIPGVSQQITDDYIAQAENAYRSYYDPELRRLRPARDVTDTISFDEIWPEFLSLWTFRRKMLTDEMVQNHLDHIPIMLPRGDAPHPELGGTVRPILIGLTDNGKGWRYFTDTWHPMVSNEHAARYVNHEMDGVYYNGGSWMRIEICGYVAGKLHGWKQAEDAIENRLWAEINLDPNFPTSQEYLATNPAGPNFGSHRVFAWNTFVFQALELAGLRSPIMDPDYKPGQFHGRTVNEEDRRDSTIEQYVDGNHSGRQY